ncbi:FecR family protein [Fodinibius sp. Rm-B-1B1-1]|uniref:FecR family protein n=1 Tax=Fodinibius alkaliphilus TaxID=3140241 RepID=UPI00315AA98D
MEIRLIARYLAGEADAIEEEKVQEWMQADPSNEELMDEFKQIWKASGEERDEFHNQFDLDEGLQELRKRMKSESGSTTTVTHLNSNYLKFTKTRFTQLLRVAAVLLIGSLIGVVVYTSQDISPKPEVTKPVLREIAMDKGQRGNITLSDGTKVILNAESKIVLPDVFKSDKREITLQGEAFLDVAHDPDRPFVVTIDDAVVEVLGTSFGVRSYPDDESVQVVVSDGKVSLGSNEKSKTSNAVLAAGEMGQLYMNDHRIVKKVVDDMDLFLGWKEGWLKFKDTNMEKVARDLERKYDVEIKFADEELKDLKLTAELKSRSFERNLEVISISLGIEYSVGQEVATFYQEKNRED